MARYYHLPIYKAAMDLGVYLEGMVQNFSRYHKYSTGQELRHLSREIIKLIIRANSARDKIDTLSELVVQCEMLKTMLFFAKESKALQSFKAFQHASSLAVVLCRQSEGGSRAAGRARIAHPLMKQRGRRVSHEHCAPPPPARVAGISMQGVEGSAPGGRKIIISAWICSCRCGFSRTTPAVGL